MFRNIILAAITLLLSSHLFAQNDQPAAEPQLNESMEEAFGELSKMLDTLDTESIFGQGGIEGLLKGFSFDGKEMQDLNAAMDSLGLSELLGGDISKMFEGGFPGMEGMDMKELDKMMEQSLGMMKDMDMSQFQEMFEGIDMSEIMKMFEGMDMEEFKGGVFPPQNPEEVPTDSKGKKLKKI